MPGDLPKPRQEPPGGPPQAALPERTFRPRTASPGIFSKGRGTFIHPDERRGRGAVSNALGRHERARRVGSDESFVYDDGWGGADEVPPPLRTIVTEDASRTVIARNASPDLHFDRSINPYRGCEHGCIYCFARPSHAQLGFSPGLDFESRIVVKPHAAERLTEELSRRSYDCRPIALGTNTDPYQPLESWLKITRTILETLAACGHPFTIVTKSALVVRDLDLLVPMAARNLVHVHVSVTTLDRKLARRMEPRAATPARRLKAIRALARAGVPTGVFTAPAIPGLTDMEMESILEAAATAGARSAGYMLLKLPLEVKDLFEEWLVENVPDRRQRVLNLLREAHGGRLYDSAFGRRMTGSGPFADLLRDRFRLAIARLGLDDDAPPLDTSQFVPPPRPSGQLSLL